MSTTLMASARSLPHSPTSRPSPRHAQIPTVLPFLRPIGGRKGQHRGDLRTRAEVGVARRQKCGTSDRPAVNAYPRRPAGQESSRNRCASAQGARFQATCARSERRDADEAARAARVRSFHPTHRTQFHYPANRPSIQCALDIQSRSLWHDSVLLPERKGDRDQFPDTPLAQASHSSNSWLPFTGSTWKFSNVIAQGKRAVRVVMRRVTVRSPSAHQKVRLSHFS